ncbi:hypothetical protein FHX74_002081 [Friedmanniella endophytica]|uniref:AAA domain-containing protein n=1 Tax=Microlunatus kandeliicorticis TaxID=1759536 RepID=A0A7W3ISK0_9ACTN|nr:AAA family ATPase [Microlunatus kandeliicorticis]MBA8794462.1 hypothetical protein [Microlunatus kandeliicorticis]
MTAREPSPATVRPPSTAAGPPEPARPDLIMVGGIPGAGKSTAIEAALRADRGPVPVRALDSDQVRRRLAARLGPRVAYRRYRPWVHTLHLLRVVGWILLGPELPGTRLVVHDPCTRPFRLRALGRLAESRGWRTRLVLVDVDRTDALAGQRDRGRVVRPDSFARHWERWQRLRSELTVPFAPEPDWVEPWDAVALVHRDDAAATLTGLLGCPTGFPTTVRAAAVTEPLALAS